MHHLRHLFSRYWPIWIFVVLKGVLLALCALPVPFGDSFFYDGAVVNAILHGKYVNPTIGMWFPTSASTVFSAGPPIYQGVLYGWMNLWGTSALASMWLHYVCVFGALLILVAIMERLELSRAACLIGSAFVVGIVFHDRAESVAQLFALSFLWCVLTAWRLAPTDKSRSTLYLWLCCPLLVATGFSTPHLGVFHGILFVFLSAAGYWFMRRPIPVGPILLTPVLVAAIAMWVIFQRPIWWQGFSEMLRQTGSFAFIHTQQPILGFITLNSERGIRIIRNLPGLLGALILMVIVGASSWPRVKNKLRGNETDDIRLPFMLALAAASLVVLCFWAIALDPFPFQLHYWQILLVACVWDLIGRHLSFKPLVFAGFAVAWALLSIRLVGLSTWGVVCGLKDPYQKCMAELDRSLDEIQSRHPDHSPTIVMSSCLMYEATRWPNLRLLHPSHALPTHRDGVFIGPYPSTYIAEPIVFNHADAVVYSQYDWQLAGRMQIENLRQMRPDIDIQVVDYATARTPGAFRPSFERVVGNMSWAPVVVQLGWPSSKRDDSRAN